MDRAGRKVRHSAANTVQKLGLLNSLSQAGFWITESLAFLHHPWGAGVSLSLWAAFHMLIYILALTHLTAPYLIPQSPHNCLHSD